VIGAALDAARERFYSGRTLVDGVESTRLDSTTAPEVKRRIIGDTFMRVSEEEIRAFGLNPDEVYLAQGTLRPDLIESASALACATGKASVIKTHHNDTALVRALRAKGRIVEPLRDLHKDEVRLLGLELGLPAHLVWRQPFPGPGLAVRILCATEPFETPEDAELVKSLAKFTSPTVGVSLVACRTVGVQGDARSYSSLVALSTKVPVLDGSVSSVSPSPASRGLAYLPDWRELFHLAKLIPKHHHGVNRVVYAFGAPLTSAHYRTITPTLLTPENIALLQKADEIVNFVLQKYRLIQRLSQVPVILFPIDFQEDGTSSEDNAGKRSICIRTFVTNDFMTGVPALPVDELEEATGEHAHLTSKPIVSDAQVPPTLAPADAFTSLLAPIAAGSTAAAPRASASPTPSPSPTTSGVRYPTMPVAALQEIVERILADMSTQVARVCFDLTSKPPATTEWE
jgi:GMP synthase (glutamine-hydrolysing)